MNRLTYEEAIENIGFTLKLASRGTPFVVECPEDNVIISPVANSATQNFADKELEGYHQGPPPMPGVGGLPSQTDVASFAQQETMEAVKEIRSRGNL